MRQRRQPTRPFATGGDVCWLGFVGRRWLTLDNRYLRGRAPPRARASEPNPVARACADWHLQGAARAGPEPKRRRTELARTGHRPKGGPQRQRECAFFAKLETRRVPRPPATVADELKLPLGVTLGHECEPSLGTDGRRECARRSPDSPQPASAALLPLSELSRRQLRRWDLFPVGRFAPVSRRSSCRLPKRSGNRPRQQCSLNSVALPRCLAEQERTFAPPGIGAPFPSRTPCRPPDNRQRSCRGDALIRTSARARAVHGQRVEAGVGTRDARPTLGRHRAPVRDTHCRSERRAARTRAGPTAGRRPRSP